MLVGTVAEIWRYPVKSMAGERVATSPITAEGIAGDRRWALRDVETGKIVSAKRPGRWGRLLEYAATIDDRGLEVTTPHGERIRLDDPAAAGLLSDALGIAVEVVSEAPADDVYASEWPEIEGLVLAGDMDFPVAMDTDSPSFVDLATLHLLTTAALRTLDGWVGEAVADVRRFRPSLLIDAEGDDIVEEGWIGGMLSIGDVEIAVGDPAPRCVMTTVAQGDLGRRPDVLEQIAAHNKHDVGGFGDFACLGVYAEVSTPGTVHEGDEVHLTEGG